MNHQKITSDGLENAEYEGDSFFMLNFIAKALKMKVEIELIAV